MAGTSYALTEEGLGKAEEGLPYKPTLYYSTLGTIADLEEHHGGTQAIRDWEIFKLMSPSPTKSVQLALDRLVRNHLIEVITPEDKRFN